MHGELKQAGQRGIGRKAMDVTLSNSLSDVDWNEVAEVFNSVGWKRSDTARVERSSQKIGIVRFAFTGNQPVGFGRAVTDGEY